MSDSRVVVDAVGRSDLHLLVDPPMDLATENGRMATLGYVLVPTLSRPREDEALTYALETFPDADVTLLAVVTPLEVVDEPTATERVRLETAEGGPGTAVPQYASEEALITSCCTVTEATRRSSSNDFSVAESR